MLVSTVTELLPNGSLYTRHFEACTFILAGQRLLGRYNECKLPVAQPAILWGSQHRRTVRFMCESVLGRVCEIQVPSLNGCPKFKCQCKTRATSGSWW